MVLTIREAQFGLRMNYSNYIGFTWIRLRAPSQVSVEQIRPSDNPEPISQGIYEWIDRPGIAHIAESRGGNLTNSRGLVLQSSNVISYYRHPSPPSPVPVILLNLSHIYVVAYNKSVSMILNISCCLKPANNAIGLTTRLFWITNTIVIYN